MSLGVVANPIAAFLFLMNDIRPTALQCYCGIASRVYCGISFVAHTAKRRWRVYILFTTADKAWKQECLSHVTFSCEFSLLILLYQKTIYYKTTSILAQNHKPSHKTSFNVWQWRTGNGLDLWVVRLKKETHLQFAHIATGAENKMKWISLRLPL